MSTQTDRATDIRDAARTLFAQRGYEATSMRAIAEAADVSLGLAYNYFSGKEDLLRVIVEEGMAQVEATLTELDTEMSPETQFRRFVTACLDTVRTHRTFWQLLYSLRQQPEAVAALGDTLDGLYDEIHARLRSLFEALDDDAPDVSARLLFATLDGVGQHYVRDPKTYPLDNVVDQVVDRFSPTAE